MKRLRILAAGALGTVTLAGFGVAATRPQEGQTGAGQEAQEATQPASAGPLSSTVQPIAFPHDIHAGTYQMDCQYCHFSAERSVDAGLPPVETCYGCHRLIPGTNNTDEVEKITGYMNRGEPIPWVRIYKISDHAHFPHMRHINAGLECQQCHGEVQEMSVIEARDPLWGGHNMGWCISCHVQEGAARDCTVCHY
jgi:hypothetical protein